MLTIIITKIKIKRKHDFNNENALLPMMQILGFFVQEGRPND